MSPGDFIVLTFLFFILAVIIVNEVGYYRGDK